jgi:hypothetical protein
MRGNNRNRKLRNITVDGDDYKWIAGGYSPVLSVWKDRKKLFSVEASVTVTPKIVEEKIKNFLQSKQNVLK